MSETAGEKADRHIAALQKRSSLAEDNMKAADAIINIRAAFERAEEADLFERALGIACHYLSSAGAYATYWRMRVLAEAARQAKEGDDCER